MYWRSGAPRRSRRRYWDLRERCRSGVALCGLTIACAACGNAVAALWTLWQAENIRHAEAEKAEWKRDFFRNCR